MIINADRVKRDVVVVAASAGGLAPLMTLCSAIGPDLPAGIAVVFHRNAFVEGRILAILQRHSRLMVVEPTDGEPFARGTVYLAPRDQHLLLDGGSFILNRGPKRHHVRPSADLLFESAAKAYGKRVVGVVLSGGGFDGALGCRAIKAKGGLVMTQALDDADFPYMPLHAMERDDVDASLPLPQLLEAIEALASGRAIECGTGAAVAQSFKA